MSRTASLLAALSLASCLAAQKMSGGYTINPNASGSRNFQTFKDVGKALFFFGVDGPVDIRIFPGTYRESFFLLPVEGASETNRITFRPLIPAQPPKLQGTSTETITMFQGVPSLKSGFYTFDGLIFERGGTAISAGKLTESVEIRNCTFLRAHSPSRGVIYIEGANSAVGWRIHHNRFEVPPSRRMIYGSQIGRFQIWANEFDFGGGGGSGLYLINNNNSLNDIWSNLFHGKLDSSSSTAAIQVNLSNINNTIAHNTFFLETSQGQAIATFGTSGNFNKIYGNVIYVRGGGTCLAVAISTSSLQNWASDGNCFWAPGGNVGKIGSGTNATVYPTLAAWQQIANKNQPQRDQNSIAADPMFVSTANPPDLHVKPGSPVQDKSAVAVPVVTEDYDGRWRDPKADIGAYELNGFAVFGKGCAGTNSLVPSLGSTGTVGVGQRFSITCTNGKPAAPALLGFGLDHRRWGAIELPLSLPGGCTVYVPLDIPFPTVLNPQGGTQVPLAVPNDPMLIGLSLHYQWLVRDTASASPFGFSHSNAGSANL